MRFLSWRFIAVAGLVVAVYVVAAKFGLSLASVHTNVSPIWPPTGIAIASLLLLGIHFWPAILVGAFLANLWTGVPVPVAGGIAVGNMLEAVIAVALLRSFKDFDNQLESVANVLRFVLCAVILSPVASATIGNLSLCLGGSAQWQDFGKLWLTWWLGDGFGAMVVAPFLLAWGSKIRKPQPRILEGLVLLAGLFVTSMVVLVGWVPGFQFQYPLAHLVFPFLVWAALRFDQRLLTATIVLIAGMAVWATSRGQGPFAFDNPNESLLMLEVFVGTSTLLALALFAAVTERRKAEFERQRLTTEVENQERRIADIVAHVPGVVWEASGKPDRADQEINFVSRYVEKMLGYTRQEWLASPNFWLKVVHPEDQERAAQEAAQIFASRKGGTSRFRWLTKDGQEVWVEAQSVVVCSEEGEPIGMRGVTMDITAQVKAEAARADMLRTEQEARAQSEAVSRLKDEFLATVSHELRTPLNAVVGWSRLLRSGQLDEEGKAHALAAIDRNAWSQKQIIEDMLDVSRIITGRLRLQQRPVELLPVLHAALDVVRPAADAKEITLLSSIDAPDLMVNGDPDRLQQIAWNLLSNAVKFTPQAGEVEVQVRRVGAQVQVCVTDTGPGIPPDFLPHAFERFSQADGSTTRRHGGLGLGLAIVRHLVELHGGTVYAANREGQPGAIFTVSLPVVQSVESSVEPDALLPGNGLSNSLKGLKILLVDDDPDALMLIEKELTLCGASVRGVTSTTDALEALQTFKADLLISDLEMPGKDGYHLIGTIRASRVIPRLPAIALTAYASETERNRALQAGFHAHLSKPVRLEELLETIRSLSLNL